MVIILLKQIERGYKQPAVCSGFMWFTSHQYIRVGLESLKTESSKRCLKHN